MRLAGGRCAGEGAIGNFNTRPGPAPSLWLGHRATICRQARREVSCAAYVPDLPGCVATGRTRADVQRRIREAIGLHLEALRGRGEHVPETSAAVEVIEV